MGTTTAALTAAIKPGISLGPFVLGMTLFDVLYTVRKNPDVFPSLEVIYGSEDVLKWPILVNLPYNGLRLQFDSPKQFLRLIEVLEWNKTKISYKGNELGKQSAMSFKQIYHKVFGPTYLGVYNDVDEIYTLSYPGIAFNFSIPVDDSDCTKHTDSVMKYLSQPSAPLCSAFAIFSGHSWHDAKSKLFTAPIHPLTFLDKESGDDQPPLEIDFAEYVSKGKRMVLRFYSAPNIDGKYSEVDLYIGYSSMLSVISDLGPPEERFLKRDSRLLIHNPEDVDSRESLVFFNYFSLGLDICFDTSKPTAPIRKIILHSNAPGSLQFQKYKKCRWSIDGRDSGTPFEKQSLDQESTMVINQQMESPSSSVEWIGGDNDNNNDCNNSSDAEDYGFTSLRGTPGCVFEVVSATGYVSTATLF